ncbi:MAG: heme lyase CcmF/NrfE family subunit [Planctomycetes bacterium]|nr:heme lyase CcmF/NrfE family subunit [Planctomycetota bacterium]
MRIVGQLCLLAAFVGSGYAAFAGVAGWLAGHRLLRRTGLFAAVASVLAVTVTLVVLAWALVTKDFSFKYVTQYSSWLLVWYYSLSALWVGQAGSLLLWAWFLGVVALAYFFWPRAEPSPIRGGTLGVLMAYLCFLFAIMVFGADPMEPSLVIPKEGAGLGPLLHHPAMLVHPPIVFIGYAAWTIPFALAVAALLSGRIEADWIREARPWALLAWTVLGVGILLGASWAYEELGWGGYWGWDPVENGSLIPWLTGSALIHTLMAWRYRGVMKKTAVALAVVTFGMCNFATFLTRSGVFSSVHAFSQSPIGWMFLIFMAALAIGGSVLVWMRRNALAAESPLVTIWSREAFILLSAVLLLLLATVTTAGTIVVPVSKLFFGRQITVGPAFYNNVLIPTGLLLLAAMGLAPVLRWGNPPTPTQRHVLLLSAGLAVLAAVMGFVFGLRHPIALAVVALATLAASALVGTLVLDAHHKGDTNPLLALLLAIRNRRRQYAGFLIHVGFVCVAIGVTGSSLGTRRHELILSEGETIEWAGRSIRYERLVLRKLPDKIVAEAVLQVSPPSGSGYTLRPARHLHLLQEEWTTEVAIHSTWSGDFYTILNSGEGNGQFSLTLVDNPLIRFLWFGGGVIVVGAIASLWPARVSMATPAPHTQRRAETRLKREHLVATE